MKQTLSILIVLLVLIGSTDVTVNQHFCGGEIQSTTLFFPAQECEHKNLNEDTPPCHSKNHCDEKSNKKCCNENQIIIHASKWFHSGDYYSTPFQNKVKLTLTLLNINYTPVFQHIESLLPKKIPDPPWVKTKHFIWNEAYLI